MALQTDAELILEMDCDFSHSPQDVPRLIAAAEEGADLVLGSRYVPGGHVGNWGAAPARRSRAPPPSTRGLFLHMGVKDPTGGFKCFRRHVLEELDLDAITPRGYAFQIETTYRVKRAGFRVVEIPITFNDRDGGLVEDEQGDRAGGDLGRASAAPASANLAACATSPTRRSRRRSWVRQDPSSSTSGRRGAAPARRSSRRWTELAAGNAGVEFVKVDIDENRRTADRFGVLSLPTVILFKDGEPRETVYGARSRKHFEKKFGPYF